MQTGVDGQQAAGGFEGAVTGMNLLDLLQVKGMARFTGRISVEQADKTGLLFFRDGEVIHAELGPLEGKAAFDAIAVWGGGKFKVEPKVTTTRQTISQRLQFLVMDAVRLQDEFQAGQHQETAPSDPDGQRMKGATVKERLAGINGLTDAVLTNRAGEPLQALGADAGTLAASGMYLVTTSEQIGERMGLGAFKGGVIQGQKAHLLALEGPKNYLFTEVSGDGKTAVVEGDIRRALSGQK